MLEPANGTLQSAFALQHIHKTKFAIGVSTEQISRNLDLFVVDFITHGTLHLRL